MKFSFAKTREEQEAEIKRLHVWHTWFAWFPVEIDVRTKTWVWLETIERKRSGVWLETERKSTDVLYPRGYHCWFDYKRIKE